MKLRHATSPSTPPSSVAGQSVAGQSAAPQSVMPSLARAARRSRRNLPLAAGLLATALAAAACGGGTPTVTSTVPSSTLPPLPPALLAYVTLIGSAPSIGQGDQVIPYELTGGSTGPEKAVTVGTFPAAIAVAPGGRTAYVADFSAAEVTPIDLATGKAEKPIPVGAGPAGIAVAPDGRTAYVTDSGVTSLGDTVTPIDLATAKAGKAILVGGGPEGIAITPDGKTAYVADTGAFAGQPGAIGDTVTPIDLATGKPGAPITVGNAPEAVVVSKDGSTVYVANANSQSVTPIDVATGVAGSPISMDGGSPDAMAVTASTVYVAVGVQGGKGDLTPLSVASNSAGTPIPVGKDPTGIAVTADGLTAWVVCNGSNSLVPVDLSTGKAGTADAVPGGPYALVLTARAQGSAAAGAALGSVTGSGGPPTTATPPKTG